MSFGGVTKSRKAAPKQCSPVGKSPWLQLSDTNEGNSDEWQKTHSHIFSISFRSGCYWWRGRRPYLNPLCHFVGHSHGLLMGRGAEQSQYYIWVPVNALSASSFSIRSTILMVVTGVCHPAFVFIGSGDGDAWIKQDCGLIEPHAPNQQLMQFTNVIGFKGKFYALSLQGTLAVMEDIETHPRITALSRSRAVPSTSSRHFREYLVESNGEILLIFLISKNSIHIVDDVEVFGLDFAKLSWIKMESLGDRTLFVGAECCMFVSASKVGCVSNCIFFTHHKVDGWWL